MMKRLILLSRYFLTPFECYNEIIPKLWLGNLQSCYDNKFLENNNIKAIVSLYTPILDSKKFTDKGITLYQLNISDNIGLHSNILMFKQFDHINNFINKHLEYGNVLIHCHYGWQRSASIYTAFLMKKFNITKEQAIKKIRNKRKLALFPESSFDLALRLYEKKLSI